MATQKLVDAKNIGTDYTFKHKIVWRNAMIYLILHLLASWGLWRLITGSVSYKTVLWTFFAIQFSSQGTLMGAHRFFAHKSYSATPLLRAILVILQTLAGQNSIYTWCRDHRVHHRYSDTDADPHNSNRGFFFSHVGWLMTKKHPFVIELGKTVDMSDLEADWMVMFQKKYYTWLYLGIAIFIPVWVPIYCWGEHLVNSLLVCFFFRYVYELNVTWLVNSAAHLYGPRPYDKNLQPAESWLVSFLSFGEGWHNYHHAFPWDYKAAELSTHFNLTAKLIRMCEKLGLAYNLKTASPEMIRKRIARTGDGSHYALAHKKTTTIDALHHDTSTKNKLKDIHEAYKLPGAHEMDDIYTF